MAVKAKTGDKSTPEVVEGNIQFIAEATAASSTTPGVLPIYIQNQIRKFSPTALFRRPVSPNMDSLRAQLDVSIFMFLCICQGSKIRIYKYDAK